MAAKKRHQVSTTENGKTKSYSQSHHKGKSGRIRENGHSSSRSHAGSDSKLPGMGYIVLVTALAALCGILHRNHIARMFESDRHFSHLSTLEREFAFRTEMGLYYSYYKTIIEAPSFVNGLQQIMYDNVTEYPDTINTLKRFNLYPEVGLGAAFRVFEATTKWMNWNTKQCWKVNRGGKLPPVWSCEGIGDPAYFYVENVFLLNGLLVSLMFVFATYLSDSVFGGLLTVVCFFYNHGESTRVQHSAPLRECFAYPFLMLVLLLVSFTVRSARPSYKHSVFIALATVSFMLPWQFAQFALLTQTMSVFACYVLMFIGSHKMFIVLLGQGVGLLISYVFLFGNEMLLTSFFAACLITVSIIVALEPYIEKIRIRFLIWVTQGVMLLGGTVAIKILSSKLLGVADDAHIGDIFRSKFSDFKNFHTMLYTCAAEFNFMEKETPVRVLKTLLAPCTLIVTVAIIYQVLRWEYQQWKQSKQEPDKAGGDNNNREATPPLGQEEEEIEMRSKPHAVLVYHLFQLLAFTLMAVLIMRLKLFWTPHLCLMTGLLASRQLFGWVGPRNRHVAILAAILAMMSVQGIANLQKQWSIMGEYSNVPLEELVDWITTKTSKEAVFAGPMPTMANVKLSTLRPIVNHPHYEDAGLRARTKLVYSMYSRKSYEEIWNNMRQLQVQYAVLENSWCKRNTRPGCMMVEIWDIEDKENRGKESTCELLSKDPTPYFRRVFRNKIYDVLEVLDKPINKKR